MVLAALAELHFYKKAPPNPDMVETCQVWE